MWECVDVGERGQMSGGGRMRARTRAGEGGPREQVVGESPATTTRLSAHRAAQHGCSTIHDPSDSQNLYHLPDSFIATPIFELALDPADRQPCVQSDDK